MARKKSRVNDKPKEYIEKAFLEESPEGLEPVKEELVAIATKIPRMEKIVFRNERDPGLPLSFHYSTGTHPLRKYTLHHDKMYELPVEVIKHLEDDCKVPFYSYRKGEDGHPEMFIKSYQHSFSCRTVRA